MQYTNNEDLQLNIVREALCAIIEDDNDSATSLLETLRPPVVTPMVRKSVSILVQARVFARDRYVCSYCSRLTVCAPVLRYISFHYSKLMLFHPHWKWDQTHLLYWEACASCDHVVPVARGGSNEMDNLATACYKCNSIKANWLLEELRWSRQPVPDTDWDGLSGLFVSAMGRKLIKEPYFRTWFRALVSMNGDQAQIPHQRLEETPVWQA